MMFCIDSTYSKPFHVLTADLIDCHGGGSELIKIFNHLGICVSMDTLLRHIQGTTQHLNEAGLLHDLDCNLLTVFTYDNIDFMHSYAQVFSGNQQVSWHGTTLQAVQCKPSVCDSVTRLRPGSRRSHALLSPYNSPDKDIRSPLLKRSRERTGTEIPQHNSTFVDQGNYNFAQVCSTFQPPVLLSIEDFRVMKGEQIKVAEFLTHAMSYCLLQNCADKKNLLLTGLQDFMTIAFKSSKPEVGVVYWPPTSNTR